MYRPATQFYTVASTTGYSVPAGYRLHSLVQLFQQLVPSTQPALNSLSRITEPPCLPTSTKNHNLKVSYQLTTPHQQPIHRPKPDDGPNNVWSQTGIFGPTQKLLHLVTELTKRFLTIQFSLSSFASHQPVTETTDLLSGAIAVWPFSYWFQRTGTDRQTTWGLPS